MQFDFKQLIGYKFSGYTLLMSAPVVVFACILFLWIEPHLNGPAGCCFPTAPDGTSKLPHPFYFQPYISQWLMSFLETVFGERIVILLGRFLLPLACLSLLIALLNRHLSVLWSIALALLALSVIAEYPFRDFLVQVIKGDWTNLGSANLPEILKFPIPGFSTFWFLLLFYLSTDKVHDELNNLKTTALTVLFSLTIYINAIDALFAVIFWFIYFPVRWWRRGQPLSKVFIKFVVQAICGLLVVAPSIYMGRIDGSLSSDTSVSLYYAIAYIALPLVLMSLLFLVQRIDPIEIIFNFRYIYAIMFAEVVVFSLSISGFLPLNLGIVENRIVQFFAHVFYFVPVIHFASRPPWNASFGLERTGFAKSLRAFISLLFGHWSKIYLPVLILLLLAYNFFSGYQYTVYIRNNVQQDVGFVK